MAEKLRPLVEPQRQTGLVSDVVSDAVFNMSPVFGVVRATGEPLNLFFNPDYRLNDIDFQIGRRRYEGWKQRFEAGGTNSTLGEPLGNILDFIFTHANFFRENLSLHHLQEVMETCTEEMLQEVQQDLMVLKEPVTLFAEIVQMMIVHIDDEFKPEPADSALPQLFSMAKVIVWIDIAMRQKGYGDLINHLRSELVRGIEKDLTPKILQEFSALGPELARAIQENILEMQKSFETLALSE